MDCVLVLVWFLLRLARFGFGMVDNRPSCPIVCTVWFCPICASGFRLIPHAVSNSRDTFATSSTQKSGMACPINLPVSPVIEASYVATSQVVGACNAGLQGLDWGGCDPLDHDVSSVGILRIPRGFSTSSLCWVWKMNTHFRKFSNLSGFGSDSHRQWKR